MIAAWFVLVFVPMIAEAAIAARHERALRIVGAVEPSDDVFKVMRVAYPGAFLAILVDGWWRGAGWDGAPAVVGTTVFAAAKGLKYWAIASLGRRWTFRVLVPRGAPRVVAGPYRWLAHPNYVAVVGEIAGAAVALRAVVGGPLALAGFGLLILKRIRIEERALAE